MIYFTNSQLKAQYGVSYAAINRWIKTAKEGKNNLMLYEEGGKSRIANTSKNELILKKLVAEGKKYLNSNVRKVIRPQEKFYELYSRKQILDIIKNLDIHQEVPLKYGYFERGAKYWDDYANRLWNEENLNFLNANVALLKANFSNINSYLKGCEQVNVIDVGSGNGLATKDFLGYLVNQEHLKVKYIALDISADLLKIVERNVNQWFGDKIEFEACNRDMTFERFDDIISSEIIGESSVMTRNIVLLLGGTLTNLRSPNEALNVIYNSMDKSDLVLFTNKLDSEASRRYFDFTSSEEDRKLATLYRVIIDMLNIDESLYDIESGYDDKIRQRFIRIRLKVAISLEFIFKEGKRVVDFNSGDTILLWRYWHKSATEVFDQFQENGFTLLHSSLDVNREYLFTASAINIKNELE